MINKHKILNRALLLPIVYFASVLFGNEETCPLNAQSTIYLKGESHVNPKDVVFRETIGALSYENRIYYCVEGTIPEDHLTSVYNPFLESASPGMLRTLTDLEDPWCFFLALLFTYRDFALNQPTYQEVVRTATENEKEEIQAVLDYYDFRKNLITLITTTSMGYYSWTKLATNEGIRKNPEIHNLFYNITEYAHQVPLIQAEEIEPVCSDPEMLSHWGDSFEWATLYTHWILSVFDELENEIIESGINVHLLRRFLLYPLLEAGSPEEGINIADQYRYLKELSMKHVQTECRNKAFIKNLRNIPSLIKGTHLPLIVILGNNHIHEVYQALHGEGYPVEIVFDNDTFLEKILGNLTCSLTDS